MTEENWRNTYDVSSKANLVTFRNGNRLLMKFNDDGKKVTTDMTVKETDKNGNEKDVIKKVIQLQFTVDVLKPKKEQAKNKIFPASGKRLPSLLMQIPNIAGMKLLIQRHGERFNTHYTVSFKDKQGKKQVLKSNPDIDIDEDFGF